MRILGCREETNMQKTPRIIELNERGKKGFYIYSKSLFSGKRRVRDSYENSWLSGRKNMNKHPGLYTKIKEAKRVLHIL